MHETKKVWRNISSRSSCPSYKNMCWHVLFKTCLHKHVLYRTRQHVYVEKLKKIWWQCKRSSILSVNVTGKYTGWKITVGRHVKPRTVSPVWRLCITYKTTIFRRQGNIFVYHCKFIPRFQQLSEQMWNSILHELSKFCQVLTISNY